MKEKKRETASSGPEPGQESSLQRKGEEPELDRKSELEQCGRGALLRDTETCQTDLSRVDFLKELRRVRKGLPVNFFRL